MLIDMHVHSSGISHCAKKDALGMIEDSVAAGLDGFVLCNHYTKKYVEATEIAEFDERYTNEYREAKKIGDALGFRVFFGIEVTMTFCCDVHMLIYGVDDEFHKRHTKLYDMSVRELYEAVKDEGGILVQAHPMRKNKNLLVDHRYIDAVELNSHIKYDGPHTDFLCDYARKHGLFVTSGGDYHADTRRTFCGVYFPDGLSDCRELKEYLVNTDIIDVQLEDEPSSISFRK